MPASRSPRSSIWRVRHRSVQQPFPGIYVWRDPHGAFYLVDHTGTRRLPGRSKPLVVEIYRNLPRLDYDAA
jgi:hypothetical protein